MNISSSSIESVFLFLLLSTTTFQSDGFSYKNLVQTQDVSQATTKSISSSLSSQSSPLIKFPGGGIYFYWEIGAASYLRDYYDLNFSSKNDNNRRFVQFSGASAGALAATLTATDVDFEKTIKLALDLADQANVWERPLGLQGVWGSIIYEWLDELIPKNEDANDGLMKYLQNDRLTLLVTPVPAVPDLFSTPAPDLFSKTKVSSFQDRKELIDCNMASVHIPWFLDGKLTYNFRSKPHIDGSFLSKPTDYIPASCFDDENKDPSNNNVISLDWTIDPLLADKGLDFISAKPKDGIWELFEQGRKMAEELDKEGYFDALA